MPQYVLPGRDSPVFQSLPPFTQAYIEAMLFTENGTDGVPETAGFRDLSGDTVAKAVIDCGRFMRRAKIDEIPAEACSRGTGAYSVAEQAGHDFWLTRNGHGAGFWDGDWAEPYASTLDRLAKSFGETWIYQGDDGRIYS